LSSCISDSFIIYASIDFLPDSLIANKLSSLTV
jgi:hypothetical protein